MAPILSGEMHYPRISHQYWRHRIQMMKAIGLNTVATYVFWNLLKKGDNQIVIFEQLNETPQTEVRTVKTPVLMKLKN